MRSTWYPASSSNFDTGLNVWALCQAPGTYRMLVFLAMVVLMGGGIGEVDFSFYLDLISRVGR